MALLMAAVTAISAMGIGTTVYAKKKTEQVLDGKTVGFAQTDSMFCMANHRNRQY